MPNDFIEEKSSNKGVTLELKKVIPGKNRKKSIFETRRLPNQFFNLFLAYIYMLK